MPTVILQNGPAVNAALYTSLTMGPAMWADSYAMTINSNQASELYAWLGNVPVMREWIGGRQAKQLREYSWRVDNKDYEATLEVHLNELRRGSSGSAIMLRIAQLAQRVQSFPSKMLTQLMVDGEATACYDGQYFFDTDHSEGDSGSQSNDISVAISALNSAMVVCRQGAWAHALAGTVNAQEYYELSFSDDAQGAVALSFAYCTKNACAPVTNIGTYKGQGPAVISTTLSQSSWFPVVMGVSQKGTAGATALPRAGVSIKPSSDLFQISFDYRDRQDISSLTVRFYRINA